MSRIDRRPDDTLPVTAEVGGEGGSYADSTMQRATFSGPANPNTSPADAMAGNLPVATEAGAGGPLAGTSVGRDDETPSGRVRYPTEPPSPPDAREGRRMTGRPWRKGLIGLTAGAAALLGLSRMRRRTPGRS